MVFESFALTEHWGCSSIDNRGRFTVQD